MWYHYCKSAIRNVFRDKANALINIAGVLIGLSACIFVIVFVQHETSFDSFHEHGSRIFRVISDVSLPHTGWRNASTEGALGPALVTEIPEVQNAVRISYAGRQNIRLEERSAADQEIAYADSSFFEVFTMPLTSGNLSDALKRPNSVLLTTTLARKLFGDDDPIGKSVHFEAPRNMVTEEREFEVTGIIEDVPLNSHFRFDALVSFETLLSSGIGVGWRSFQFWTYILLRPGSSPTDVEEEIRLMVERLRDMPIPDMAQSYFLQPLKDVYFSREGAQRSGDIRTVRIFSLVAVLILLIASITYVNLTTARAINRGREVGVRKALGAQRWQLTAQFLFEALLLALATLPLALLIVRLGLPRFRDLVGRDIVFDLTSNGSLWISLAGLVLLFCAVAGSYPAFLLSRFDPATALRGNVGTYSTKAVFRGTLIVLQFTISVALISITLVSLKQNDYVYTKDLGFRPQEVVTM